MKGRLYEGGFSLLLSLLNFEFYIFTALRFDHRGFNRSTLNAKCKIGFDFYILIFALVPETLRRAGFLLFCGFGLGRGITSQFVSYLYSQLLL